MHEGVFVMSFNERDAIKIRIQQIFLERQSLQDEYKTLFSRLREIDDRDLSKTYIQNETEFKKTDLVDNVKDKKETHKSSKQWEEINLSNEEEEIDMEEYDKRLDELQAFLEAESE